MTRKLVCQKGRVARPSDYVIQTDFPEDAKPGTDPKLLRTVPHWYAGLAPMPEEHKMPDVIAPLWSPYTSDILLFPDFKSAWKEAEQLKKGLNRFSVVVVSKSKIVESWPDPKPNN